MLESVTRRDALTKAASALALAAPLVMGVGALAAEGPAGAGGLPGFTGAFKDGQYALPALPYAYDALEPHIDAKTMQLHHDKHHLAYVEGLNKAIKSLADLRTAGGEIHVSALGGLQEDLSFNAGGHLLHTAFWNAMGPRGGGDPKGAIGEAIAKAFGSAEAFKAHFSKAAAGVKGSGWALLAYEPAGDQLLVLQIKQHDLQLAPGILPLLPLDVWEHAYYLKYQNGRAAYITAWWNVVNWMAVNDAYIAARKTFGR